MIGMLIWDRAGHGLRPVRMKEISVLHVRFLCGEVTALERTAAVARSHRLRTAGRRLLRQGVERVVLPEGSAADVLPKGLRPVSTLALRRAIAADWAGELLRLRQRPPRWGTGAGNGQRTLRRGSADGDGAGAAPPLFAADRSLWR